MRPEDLGNDLETGLAPKIILRKFNVSFRDIL